VAPRARLFDLIAKTPSLDWLLLTKRPQNMVRLAPASWADRWPGNAWAGTTIEDEERLAERAPHLFKVPAPVKFYSMEPLLESVDISDYLVVGGPDWVIVGGESGPGARPMHLSWVRNIVHDCLENGVAPFVKQYGEQPYDWTPDGLREDVNPRLVFEPQWSRPVKLKEKKGGDIDEFEPMLRVRQVPGYADVDGIEVRS
jgi:protein gp37